MIRSIFISVLFYFLTTASVLAETTADEQRARDIGSQLRCVVCQNQSIEASDAELAVDMRREVREQVAAGASNQDVIDYMRNNYGDYVLLKPPVQPNTYALWFLPGLLILFGLSWFTLTFRKGRVAKVAESSKSVKPISAEDKSLLDDLLRDNP